MIKWYALKTNGNPLNAEDYFSVGYEPPLCRGRDRICAVQANGEDTPHITTELKTEMIVALTKRDSISNVLLHN